MSKIIKYVSLNGTPLVLNNSQVAEAEEQLPKNPQPAELLRVASSEADTIIAEAQKKADTCMAEANRLIEQIKKDAYNEGFQLGHKDGVEQGVQQGYNQGFEHGKQTALADSRQTIDDAVQKAQSILADAERETKEMILAAERQIIELSLAVARKILVREIEENPTAILPIVRSALQKVRDQERITIRVNPDDFERVLHARKDLQVMIGSEHALTVSSDLTIQPGGCVIDTPFGAVDARIDSQFEVIKKALQEIMP